MNEVKRKLAPVKKLSGLLSMVGLTLLLTIDAGAATATAASDCKPAISLLERMAGDQARSREELIGLYRETLEGFKATLQPGFKLSPENRAQLLKGLEGQATGLKIMEQSMKREPKVTAMIQSTATVARKSCGADGK